MTQDIRPENKPENESYVYKSEGGRDYWAGTYLGLPSGWWYCDRVYIDTAPYPATFVVRWINEQGDERLASYTLKDHFPVEPL